MFSKPGFTPFSKNLAVVLLGLLAGLTVGRLLYETFFPALLWLAYPLPNLFLAAVAAAIFWLVTFKWRVLAEPGPFLPLLLNLAYLAVPETDILRGWFFFLAGLWLTAVLLRRQLMPGRYGRLDYLFLLLFLAPIYLLTMGQSVGQADTFEFQVVIPRSGIVHPTGYPLYLLLTRLFTLLPLNSVAWRINFGTAVYALSAVCLLYALAYRLSGRRVPALATALLFGLTPTFWSQAVAAEVYSLHALIVAAVLLVMERISHPMTDDHGQMRLAGGPAGWAGRIMGQPSRFQLLALLMVLIGLGLTNHLTTLILLPAAGLLLLRIIFAASGRRHTRPSTHPLLSLLFLLPPLLLYIYLPLRWQAVNGEPMGWGRFVDWVIGGRFQGALRLSAWLTEPVRYEIVGRLLLAEWGWLNLLWAALGFALLLRRRRWPAFLLLITWLGYLFYALNYDVPDLAVFMIPLHLIIALCWGAGLAGLFRLLPSRPWASLARSLALVFFLTPVLANAVLASWPAVDKSGHDGLTRWGEAVLSLPLDPNGAILADSEKIAPLYYLQQAEGLRPEMDIVVLPDEAAYRAELDGRLAAGQSVYLARFLPGLEGIYHLRSLGPLIEVSGEPLMMVPETAAPAGLHFDDIQLLAYELDALSPYNGSETALTLYWQADRPLDKVLYIYTRWAGPAYDGQPTPAAGQHPANNYYPTAAWQPGEIVPDYHALPRPIWSGEPLALQAALAPPFTSPDELAWQTITEVELAQLPPPERGRQPVRLQLGPLALDGIDLPAGIRPQTPLPVTLSGSGGDPERLILSLTPAGGEAPPAVEQRATAGDGGAFVWAAKLATDLPAGRYDLWAAYPGETAVCGWGRRPASACRLAEIDISGAPLPPGAVNFGDKIALLAIELPGQALTPGSQFSLQLKWQALAPIAENYTVFIQILDEQDRLVGQVDAWPRQGTFPTGQWRPGQVVDDPYLVQLAAELPPGSYRLQVGWYLLATLQRLPVLNADGAVIDDKVSLAVGTIDD